MATEIGQARLAVAVLLIVAGALSGILFLVLSLMSAFGSLARGGPDGFDAALQPGGHTVYWETTGLVAFRYSSGPDADVTVVPREGGAPIPVSDSGPFSSHYSTGDRVGYSIARFSVEQAGTYRISAKAPAGKTLPAGGLSVSKALGFFGILKIVFITLALLGGGVGGGVYLLVKPPASPSAPGGG